MAEFSWFAAALILAAMLDLGLMLVLRQSFNRANRPALTLPPDRGEREGGLPLPPGKGELEGGLTLPPIKGELEGGLTPAPKPRWYQSQWVEWLVIILAVTLYCTAFLDLAAPTRLPGNESEIFQLLDWALVNSLRQFGKFPLWNPYIQAGVPFIADPMLHVYNPVVTLPVLLFGVRAGFKLGVYFSFLIGALGMWKLGHTLGLGRPARLWIALMFAFAGQPTARFFQGQYLFVLAFAYIPWIIASLLQVAAVSPGGEKEKFYRFSKEAKRPGIAAAFSLALFFFSGNAYYQLYMLLATGLLLLVLLPSFRRWPPFVKLNLHLLKNYLLVGVLALGLIAIQLLPTVEFWPRLAKDTHIVGSHTVGQIFLDYTSKDSQRPDAYSVLPAREEFYAYIGLTPFLALSLLPLALAKHPRRPQLFFILLLGMMVLWISLEAMPWRAAFLESDLLVQFRHLLRILIFGSFALILLAGFGLDTLWGAFSYALHHSRDGGEMTQRRQRLLRLAAFAGLGLQGAFMLGGVLDVFNTNQPILYTQQIFQPAYEVQSWMARYDPSDYYVRHLPVNSWQEATVSHNLRFLDIWYHFNNIVSLDGKINERWVQAEPLYQSQSPNEQAPENGELIQEIEGTHIYRLPDSLPIAFLVERSILEQPSDRWLQASEVIPLAPFFASTGKVELISDVQGDQVLVLLTTHYPGWRVAVDDANQPLLNVGGYLAVAAPPGVHKVTFTYQPLSFYLGLLISLAACAFTISSLRQELRQGWRGLLARMQTYLAALRRWRARLQAWWQAQQAPSRMAIYKDGTLHLDTPLALAEQTQVRVTVEPQAGGLACLRTALQRWLHATGRLVGALVHAIPLPTALFILGLALYLLTRLNGLEDWPIYFFTDEAVQTVMAEDFIHNGLRNPAGEFLPTYFSKDATYNLSSLSVYLQVIPYLLFGKSVFVTRAVSVLAATFGAVMVGLALRDIFKLRTWWSGVLLLSIIPAWFLHSRTAFETVEMTAFYAAFLYFYLRYRAINPRALYAALVFGALVFYTYSPGQLIIVVSGIFLLLSDLRYHWQQRRVALRGLLLLAVLVLPFLRYYLAHPLAPLQHLTTRAPYWLENIPLVEKLAHYFGQYLAALDPRYWFLPNQHDLDRHLMLGYGHISLWMLPLLVIGLGVSLFKLRLPAHRAVLLALLAAPSGSALVEVGVTRLLVLVVPVTILVALGLDQALEWAMSLAAWLIKRLRQGHSPSEKSLARSYAVLALALALVLGGINLAMLRDARLNGPLWYQDYTLGGMQYGARQLFTAVIDYYQENPTTELMVSPSWTNGADAVVEFFLPPGAPVTLGSVEGHIFQRLPLDDDMVFVVIPNELDKLINSGKFEDVRIEQTIDYPNGEPGFYFIRMRYVADIDRILEVEREARRALLESQVEVAGQQAVVRYPVLDMGGIELVFDGDANTLARTLEANPFVIELTFPTPRPVSGASLRLGSAYVQVTVSLTTSSAEEPIVFETTFHGSVAEPELNMDFDRAITIQQMRFEILAPGISEPANIHIWEITIIE